MLTQRCWAVSPVVGTARHHGPSVLTSAPPVGTWHFFQLDSRAPSGRSENEIRAV